MKEITHNSEKPGDKEKDPQAVTLWVMRHAPTTWNLEKRVQGNVDTHIDPEALLPYLERVQVKTLPQPDRIILTEFQRTGETADGISTLLGWPEIPRVVKPALNERKWGIFEGKTHAEILNELMKDPHIRTTHPDLESMTDLSPILDAPGFKVEGSEAMDEVAARVTPALSALRDEYPGEQLLLIAHAGVLISQKLDHRIINQLSIRMNEGEKEIVHRHHKDT